MLLAAGVVLKSTNGGSGWALTAMSGDFKTVSCKNNVIYVGNASAQTMLKSTDYGTTYTTLSLPFSYDGII